jgi:hypothetical protein
VALLAKYISQYRVQRKRFNELEKARKQDILQKMKRDHEFSKEVIGVMRSTAGRESAARTSQVIRLC